MTEHSSQYRRVGSLFPQKSLELSGTKYVLLGLSIQMNGLVLLFFICVQF